MPFLQKTFYIRFQKPIWGLFVKFQFLPNFAPLDSFWIFHYEIQYLTTSIFETFYVRHTKVYGIILTNDIHTQKKFQVTE